MEEGEDIDRRQVKVRTKNVILCDKVHLTLTFPLEAEKEGG